MSQPADNLDYVKQAIDSSNTPTGFPALYVLWGCIIFLGFAISEFSLQMTSTYWLIAAPVGMAISAWLGIRADKAKGQQDARTGKLYLQHFAIMLIAIFSTVLTQQYVSILLIIALGYSLAGLHLDRPMLWIGVLTFLTYLGIAFGIINSQLIVGTVLAAGCFLTAWVIKK